jgi:hypothetical protein
MKKLLFYIVVAVMLGIPSVMADEGTPKMKASACMQEDGMLFIRNANRGDVDATVGLWVDGSKVSEWLMAAGASGSGANNSVVTTFRLSWKNGDSWVTYLNVSSDNARLCDRGGGSSEDTPVVVEPAPSVVILVDPDGVLPVAYPHELLTQGGTFWDKAEVWHNDVFDVVGWTIFGDVHSGFADGFAWLHATNGDDIYVELVPDPDERTGQWMAKVIAFYQG